jgi:hypothetical protein
MGWRTDDRKIHENPPNSDPKMRSKWSQIDRKVIKIGKQKKVKKRRANNSAKSGKEICRPPAAPPLLGPGEG